MTQQQYGRAIVRGEQSFWTGDGKPDWLPGDVVVGRDLPLGLSERKADYVTTWNWPFRLPLPDYQFVYDALDRGERPDFTNRTSALAGEPETACHECGGSGRIEDRVDGMIRCPSCGYGQKSSDPDPAQVLRDKYADLSDVDLMRAVMKEMGR